MSLCNCFNCQPCSTKSLASQSSNRMEGRSPMTPKSEGVPTRPRPKCSSQTAVHEDRATSGFVPLVSQRAKGETSAAGRSSGIFLRATRLADREAQAQKAHQGGWLPSAVSDRRDGSGRYRHLVRRLGQDADEILRRFVCAMSAIFASMAFKSSAAFWIVLI